MRIPLDPQSSTPLYQQIENYLRDSILSGVLAPETKLPATRQLAQELGISRITVNNAYATLESEGLVYSREGSGTFVLERRPLRPLADSPAITWPLWQQVIERPDTSLYESQMNWPDHNAREPIAFTGVGFPQEYPIKELLHALQDVLRSEGAKALDYGALDSGYAPLRQTIAHVLASQGITAHPDQILITTGSQQALALVCQVLLRPGGVVVVENPTYNLALELFRELDLKIVGVPVDAEGMQVERLEPVLQQYHPQLIYTIPNFQNPTGSCLSGARRRQLVALGARYNVPILEDDFAGDLRYEGRTQAALRTLAATGGVIYTGTFSKMLMPGLRVGFVVAEGPIFKRLVNRKRVHDLTTSPLMQRALDAFVNIGQYQSYVRRSCRLYRQHRDSMLTAIQRYLPPTVQVAAPQGGIFLWLRLPPGQSCLQLMPWAAAEGVSFAPGVRFFVNPADGEPFIRLNFAHQTPAAIEEGIQRLGNAVARLAGGAPHSRHYNG